MDLMMKAIIETLEKEKAEQVEINPLKQYGTITITMRNGNTATWNKGEWSDYRYDGKCFIVILNDAWIGFYNIDEVYTIVVE